MLLVCRYHLKVDTVLHVLGVVIAVMRNVYIDSSQYTLCQQLHGVSTHFLFCVFTCSQQLFVVYSDNVCLLVLTE